MRTRSTPGGSARGRFARLVAALTQSVGNPLEWTDVQKTVLLIAPTLPFVSFYLFRVRRLIANPAAEPYIDRPSLMVLEQVLVGMVVVFSVLGLGWLAWRKTDAPRDLFVRTTINTWFVLMGFGSYSVGPYSSPVLLGFLAGGMCAFLLYDVRRASQGAALGMLAILGTTVLERLEVLPYGPVFAGVVFNGERPPDVWVLLNTVFTVVLTVFVLAATGIAVTIARQRQEEIDLLLREDPLTGLLNRRTLDDTLAHEVSRAQRTGAPLAFVMLDLDHFKNVNDTFGHRAGDLVLAATGQALRELSRGIDQLGRYGGEELVLVLPETDLEGARVAAERLRSAVEALEVSLPAGETLRVTVSAGCSVLAPGYSTDMDELQRDADVALYRAKSLGRNRVELAEGRST